MKVPGLFASLLAFFASLASGQEITAEALGPGQFRMLLRSPRILETSRAQELLLPRALELCQGLQPIFGRYSFSSAAPIPGQPQAPGSAEFELVQDLSCGAHSADSQPGTARNSAFGAIKSDHDQSLEEFVRVASVAYLQQRAEGEFEQAYMALSEAMREFQPAEEWTNRHAEFNAAAGKRIQTSVWRVTIYDNPPNAPEPGIHIAADYENEFERVPFQCGYLIWFQSAHDRFVITREESGSLPSEMTERLTRQQLAEVRRRFGCPAR
jgi:hypothetical protein